MQSKFAHKLAATVESGQKGGGAMCALEGSQRTGDFAPSEADRVRGAGARDSRAAGAPFTAMGHANKAERPS